ncbi:MAG: (Dimethylallyl)adenosine tRNA methylthiotransferase MiaB [Microgenomates group bacterium GW2011_GWF2_45_18]|nr:MAG: (Dimethylallyl)adenosine tRNA methylthiotransferase MiaB [Microgenomates group bacterium GW2011_GWF1_44_10]KKU02001.1 MAG: (Dimethylallyl)adenosine tRNA methylthiotransferase MiaB [Microgenomates group bacterium GW2011_GWF2_45_18]OGJ41187.1 MAG: hypothetical protein A2378_00890 [Candidatus Pacebacteria bacterium RIFOXYB1_FULL_44_10]HAU99013.1 tRNA (N6-isopentenyl adenosine(37)-C2)-methylthiotransferase MiaB [Candidatus Paceibacterota bacterium]HAX01273.1 tRNA (N6-isopentenyl adenosine(3
MPSYFIHTFGCQSNKSDSERIAGDYAARGYTEARSWKLADEIVINTCAIRESAEQRARHLVFIIAKFFADQGKQKPKIILTGCMVHHGYDQLYKMMPGIDEILPINEVGFNQSAVRKEKTHAWIPISAGCNSFCTYCIVPYSRGREQSRAQDEILTEVRDLAQKGYSEVTLLGQNVNSWGLEKVGIGFRKLLMSHKETFSRENIPDNQSQYLKPKGTPPFVRLLQEISKIDGIEKIRFMTSNPWDFHEELIDEIAKNKKIDRFLHLPIQSGSNSVLYRMNRGYTREDYLNLIERIRAKVPDAVFGSDIIVGFPDETDAEFEDTVDLAKKVGWKVAFVAMYSPRPGTASWRIYTDNIPHTVKKKRWEILDQIINKDNLVIRPKVVK